MAIKAPDGRVANRSLLVDPLGNIVARYDKIHMFDVDLGSGESYRESATISPARTPCWRIRLGVRLGFRSATTFGFRISIAAWRSGRGVFVNSGGVHPHDGRAHWHVLLRARAIENGAFVFASAQTGTHAEGQETYGHSLIVDPWGTILADAGEEPGLIYAEIDPDQVEEARRRVPSLTHDRPFA